MSTKLLTAAQAAEARAASIRTPGDRPSARRGAAAADAPALVRMPLTKVEFRAAGEGSNELTFDGIACAYERSYEMWDMWGPYTEVVSAGAGEKTLSRSPDVAFLLNHRGMTLARTKSGTLTLSEEDEGLRSVASLDARITDVRNIQIAVERGDLDEMSFAFRITRGKWSPDYSEYRIEEYDLDRGDVSVVNFGANPHTSAALRSGQVLAALAELDDEDLERAQAAIASRRSQRAAGGMDAGELAALLADCAPHPLAARFGA
jgi:HK97 family phage prohead protease